MMYLKEWEVSVPGKDSPIMLLAFTKAQAIQTATELCPEINPTAVNITEHPDWS